MKKIICMALAMMLLLSLCGCKSDNDIYETGKENIDEAVTEVKKSEAEAEAEVAPVTEEAEEELSPEEEWKIKRAKYMAEIEEYYEEGSWQRCFAETILNTKVGGNSKFLADINLDGVPELIMETGAAGPGWCFGIYQMIDGEAQFVCGFLMNESDKSLVKMDYYEEYRVSFCSSFNYDWLRLRKNKQTGEYKYFMKDAYDATYRMDTSETELRLPVPVELFSDSFDPIEYKVNGKLVTEEEFIRKKKDFNGEWEDTAYRVIGLSNHGIRYRSNAEPYEELNANVLQEFFNAYVPEKEYIEDRYN